MSLKHFFLFFFMVLTSCQQEDKIESQVLYWLNAIRANPQIIIPHIRNQLSRFNGTLIPLAPFINYATKEGSPAWTETIQFLQQQKPIGNILRHSGLDMAAQDHAIDLKLHNAIKHEGSDGSSPADRIERYCIYKSGYISEDIAQQFLFEGRNHGLETIVSLIIDDGIKDRGHRKSLFNPKLQYAGVNTQKTEDHYLTVIDLSSENLPLKPNVTRRIITPPASSLVLSPVPLTPSNQTFNNATQTNNFNSDDPLSVLQNFEQFKKIFLAGIPQGKSIQSVSSKRSSDIRTQLPSYNLRSSTIQNIP